MRPEFGVVQVFDCVFHVIVVDELDHTGAVLQKLELNTLHNTNGFKISGCATNLEDVGVADLAGVAHMILQILPAARRRQTRHDDSIVGATGRTGGTSAVRATTTRSAASRARLSTALLELDAQLVALEVVAVAALDGVLGIARVLVLDKGKGRALAVLQVHEPDLAVLVEEVLDFLGANVRRQVANVDSRVRFAHSFVLIVKYIQRRTFFFCCIS